MAREVRRGVRSKPTREEDRPGPLIVDEFSAYLEQFQLLVDDREADWLLSALGGSGNVEREIAQEMATTEPLAHPDRFADAHVVVMRALEVLSRNGSRAPSQVRAGPLTPAVQWLVQRVTRYVVRRHQRQVVRSVLDLYTQRLAWVATGERTRSGLVRAVRDVRRAASSYRTKKGGLPTFLVGGAAVSTISRGAQVTATTVAGSTWGLIAAAAAGIVLVVAASWVILRGASVARRRIRGTLDRPLAGLWETVGSCGAPPRDGARAVALTAVLVTVVGWLLIPTAIGIALATR